MKKNEAVSPEHRLTQPSFPPLFNRQEIESEAIKHLTRRLKIAQTRAADYCAYAEALEKEAASAQTQLAYIMESRAWVWTEPFRRVSRFLSRRLRFRSIRQKLAGHFDEKWYVSQYPEALLLNVDPFAHYLCSGATKQKNPNPAFDAVWYLRRYPDVCAARIDPLAHFVEHGKAEGRDPHPNVTCEKYEKIYPKVNF